MEKYDVFISYRRGSGLYMAKNIATNLQNMGYRVFFDYDSMHNNEFDVQIYEAIKNSKDFILVLTENSLDRCSLPDDWVAREVLCAKQHKKNIILATDAERFKNYPPNLPQSMDFLRRIDWTPIHPKLFEGSLKLLRKRLTSRTSKLKYFFSFIFVVLLFALGIITYICYPPKSISFNVDDEESYSVVVPAELDKEEDVDDFESQYPREDELVFIRSSSKKTLIVSFFIEDFEEIIPKDYNWSEADYETNIEVLKTYTLKDYVNTVRKNVKAKDTSWNIEDEPLYFETNGIEWGLMSLINKDDNMQHWRFSAKMKNTVYANVIIVTPMLNILQRQRFIFNAKKYIEKNSQFVLNYLEQEYS